MEKPIILDPETQKLDDIKRKYRPSRIIDTYKEQLEDLFLIRNPKYRFNKNYKDDFELFLEEHARGKPLQNCGKWIFFPWDRTLVHYLDDGLHQEVRTARNKHLISGKDQKKFYNTRIGIAGLSVGSHAATTIALMGGGKLMKLADPDTILPSNLNRMRFEFTQVGINKTEAVARYIYQLNPYSELYIYEKGIDKKNLNSFLEGIDILIEELDDIIMKVKIREEAKKRRIPVVMATDNGDGIIVDIERFDLNHRLPVFHGNLKGFNLEGIKNNPTKMYEAMARIIDIKLVPLGVLKSVLEVGKTIYSWPQLASAATLSGAVLSYVVRKIALADNIKSGKINIDIDLIFNNEYDEYRHKKMRKIELRKFLQTTGIKVRI